MSNVIIIGNGPSVLKRDMGEKIDSFDKVVRLNNYEIAGFDKKVGTRTDIWGRSDASDIKKIDTSLFEKIIVFIPPINYKREDRLLGIKDLLQESNADLCPEEISIKTSLDIGCGRREWPSTGLLAINYFIINHYKDIYLYGFDGFMANGNFRHYYSNKMLKYKGHNPDKEKAFIKLMTEKNKINIL